MNQTMLTPMLQANMDALRMYFFEKSDPAHPGENPHCRVLEDAIEAELRTWSDDKLKAFGDSLDADEAEFLFGALCGLSDVRSVLKPKFD